MGWTRAELKERAKYAFKANYWKSVLVAFILMVIGGNFSTSSGSSNSNYTGNDFIDSVGGRYAGTWLWVFGLGFAVIFVLIVVGLVLNVFLLNPLNLGCKKYFLDASEGKADLNDLGYAFRNCYTNVTFVLFLQDLFLVLWTCLFIIPGIYKIYEYRMIPYLLAEDPQLSFTPGKESVQGYDAGREMECIRAGYLLLFLGDLVRTDMGTGGYLLGRPLLPVHWRGTLQGTPHPCPRALLYRAKLN
jgi:uncharacterized membrane protein